MVQPVIIEVDTRIYLYGHQLNWHALKFEPYTLQRINQYVSEFWVEYDVEDGVAGTGEIVGQVLDLAKHAHLRVIFRHLVVDDYRDQENRSLEKHAHQRDGQ